MVRNITFTLFLSLLCVWAHATHIVGGNMGYAYMGPGPGGTFRYKITLITYTDCSPTSEIPVPEPSVNIGVYFHDSANPNAAKTLKQALVAPLVSSQIVTPPLPPGCSIGLGTCIYKGVYETEVLLEASVHGYHIYYERCCRNTALVNIVNPSQTSTGFYSFIPPTSTPNSSPVFLDDPVPLICVGDSLFLLNTAVDPDGDMLLYSFTTPYAGFADILNPAPLPEPVLQWPITPVVYQGTFSAPQPFGPGGYTYLNAVNGLSIYKTALTGNFVVAVEVKEYRNGTLLSSTRRDMQLISLVCPQNQAPTASFPSGLNVQIAEGDTVCFDFAYTDPEMDSVFLDAQGEPFLMTPPATLTQQYANGSLVQGKVCWAPPCGSARTMPYFITYGAYDDGCIPKTRINIMQITVVPDTADLNILGDTLVCGLETATYQSSKPFGTFQWIVTGGALAQPGTGPSATINWNLAQGQQGHITLIRDGLCADDTAHITVSIAPPTYAGHMPDIWLCPGSSDTLQAEPGGSNYQWTPGTWLSDSTIANPVTNTPDSLYYSVIYRDSVGCEKFDSLLVVVNSHVPINPGNAVAVCEGLPVTLGGSPTGPQGSVYQWTPTAAFTDPTVSNPTLPNPQSGWYTVHVTVDTCHAQDSVQVTIFALPDVDAGNDTSVCAQIPFPLNGSGTGAPTWSSGGATLNNLNSFNPIFSGDTGTYNPILTVVSPEGCSASDTVQITIWPLPDIAVTGNLNICRGDTAMLTATGADNYLWNFSGYLSHADSAVTQAYNDVPTWISVTGTDANGCASKDSVIINVFRVYMETPGDTVLCLGESVALTFASDSSVSTVWSPVTFLNPATGETVTSTPEHDITYTVYAFNQAGCADSATVTLLVKPLPTLDIGYEAMLFCEYVEVKLNSNNNSDSLYWLVNNTPSGTGQQATVHLNPKQPETVYLVGVSPFGCADTLSLNPDFASLEDMLPGDYPNIITPNDDNLNDLWNPPLPPSFADCTRLVVYNRWGAEVFDSRTFPIAWNGKNGNDKPLTDGVYFYILEIGGIFKKGTITITK